MIADDDVLFSRVNRSGDDLAELRVNMPKVLLAVLDMVAISETELSGKMVSRTDIVHRVLSRYVENKIYEAELINKAIGNQVAAFDKAA